MDGCFGDLIIVYVMMIMFDVYMIWSGNLWGDMIYFIIEWLFELWNEICVFYDYIFNLVLDDICL